MTWVTDQLFMGFTVDDMQSGDAQLLTIYFDVDGSSDTPDGQDRAFQVGRDGILRLGAYSQETPIGGWTWLEEDENWDAVVAERPNGRWVIELGINAALEMPAMLGSQAFGLLVTLGQDGAQGVWPDGGLIQSTETWQPVDNSLCN